MNDGIIINLNEKPVFDTRKAHLIIPGSVKPPYLGVIDVEAGPLAVSGGGSTSRVVLKIAHGLGYAPFVDTYFYPASAQPANPDQYFQITDSYYKNFFSYINLGGSGFSDLLTVKVDDININVTHTLSSFSGPATSTPFPVKMKYSIYANEGYLQP